MLKCEAKKGDFAKIWQKLGGGLQPPQPPGSAAHVFVIQNFKKMTTVDESLKLKFGNFRIVNHGRDTKMVIRALLREIDLTGILKI